MEKSCKQRFATAADMCHSIIFREELLREAIKFESWTFLEKQFSSQAKELAQWRTAKQRKVKPREKSLEQLKIWQLSRKFPMFNEDAVSGPVLDNWSSHSYYG